MSKQLISLLVLVMALFGSMGIAYAQQQPISPISSGSDIRMHPLTGSDSISNRLPGCWDGGDCDSTTRSR